MDLSEKTKYLWDELGKDYSSVGKRIDSLDQLLEFTSQLDAIGNFSGQTILDLGCGPGEKSFYLAQNGAKSVLGVDISQEFINKAIKKYAHENLNFIYGDLSKLKSTLGKRNTEFDLITCFQAISYAPNLAKAFQSIASYLRPSGKFVVSFASPIRFPVEKAERFNIPVAKAYKDSGLYSYPATWNSELIVEHNTYKISDILNAFSSSNFYVQKCIEPSLSNEDAKKYPHKAKWMDKYGGIIIFVCKKIL